MRNGVKNARNLRRELISHEELMTHIRQAGADDLARVRRAWVEGNGEISVLLESDEHQPPRRRQPAT